LMVVTRFTRAPPAFAITAPFDGRDPLHPGSARVRDHFYNPKIREAMMFFWICDVPPITLWARL
jgi:hypothetical protein